MDMPDGLLERRKAESRRNFPGNRVGDCVEVFVQGVADCSAQKRGGNPFDGRIHRIIPESIA
jgi:hypothetical protein